MPGKRSANWFRALGECPCNLMCLLREPLFIGMGCAAGKVHPPAAHFDDEQPYNRRSEMVSTVKKSTAMRLFVCA
jgi:hypothetical protein